MILSSTFSKLEINQNLALAPLVYRIANVRSLDYAFGTAVCIREHKWQHVMMSQH